MLPRKSLEISYELEPTFSGEVEAVGDIYLSCDRFSLLPLLVNVGCANDGAATTL